MKRTPEPLLKNWRFYAALFLVALGVSACSSENPSNVAISASETPTSTPTALPSSTLRPKETSIFTPTASLTPTPKITERSTRTITRVLRTPTATPNFWQKTTWKTITDAEIDRECPCSDIIDGPNYEELGRVLLIPSGERGYDENYISVGYRLILNADFLPKSTSKFVQMDLFGPDQYDLVPGKYWTSVIKRENVTPVARIRSTFEPPIGWDGHNFHFEGGRGYPGSFSWWNSEWQNLDPIHPARISVYSKLVAK